MGNFREYFLKFNIGNLIDRATLDQEVPSSIPVPIWETKTSKFISVFLFWVVNYMLQHFNINNDKHLRYRLPKFILQCKFDTFLNLRGIEQFLFVSKLNYICVEINTNTQQCTIYNVIQTDHSFILMINILSPQNEDRNIDDKVKHAAGDKLFGKEAQEYARTRQTIQLFI